MSGGKLLCRGTADETDDEDRYSHIISDLAETIIRSKKGEKKSDKRKRKKKPKNWHTMQLKTL